MEVYSVIALSAITGFLVKLCDDIVDKKLGIRGGHALAFLYGSIIAYMILNSGVASLWFAVVLGVALMGKIDDTIHVVALVPVTLVLLFYFLGHYEVAFDAVLLLVFGAATIFDEWAPKIKSEKLRWVKERRPALDVITFFVSLFTGNWMYITSILSFDALYLLTGFFVKKKIKVKV